ncbi:MAG: restriction endonuclease subunit S [Clostridiaceae bacterium]|nr:restriction endonuclease subunit S [Clostridiaceae bacterium]
MEKYKIGDICEIVSGSTPKTENKDYWDGDLKWITPAEINEDSYIITDTVRKITSLAVKETNLSLFPEGTVILSSRAPIGKVAIAGCEMYCNQGFKNLICKNKINNKYLYWFLKGNTAFLQSLGRGATFKEISKQIVSNIEINVPDYDRQIEVATHLEKINKIIHLRRQELLKFDDLIKSRFIELFGTENELDKWPCCTIGEVADVCVGVVIKPTQYYADKGIPAFRSLNIGKMQVKDNDWVYFTEEGHQKNQKSIIYKNDVLVVRSGAPGTACVATEKYDGYNAIDIIIAHPDSSKVNPVFLAAFTNMPHGMNQIREKTSGAAQQHFNVGGYKTMCLIMPSMELQNQFAAFVEQTNKSKFKEIQFLKTTHILLKQCFFEKQSQQNRQKLQGGT